MLAIVYVLTSASVSASDTRTLDHDMPRPSPTGSDALVMDMTKAVLSSREKRRLVQKIRRIEASINLQLLIAPSVEDGYNPKDMATSLLNEWKMGSQPRNPSLLRKPVGGMLILLVMSENRLEIEFSDNLGHLFDKNWVHNLLYTELIPFFREDRYSDGLTRIVDATQERLEQYLRAMQTGGGRRGNSWPPVVRRKRRWDPLSAVLGFGSAWMLRGHLEGNGHTNDGDDLLLLPPPSPPSPPPQSKGQGQPGGTSRPFISSPPAPAAVEANRSSDSLFAWQDLAHLLGRGSSKSNHYGTTKTGGNNVHIHVGSSSTVSVDESSPTAGRIKVSPIVSSEKILKSQCPPSPPPPPPPPPQMVENTATSKGAPKSDATMNSSPTSSTSIHLPTFLRSAQRQSFGISHQKVPKSTPSVKEVSPKKNTQPRSSGLGGGASWTSPSTATANSSKRQTKTSILSPSSASSSGKGGGASWSTSPLLRPQSTRSSSTSTASSVAGNNKSSKNQNRKSSSSNGGGASW